MDPRIKQMVGSLLGIAYIAVALAGGLLLLSFGSGVIAALMGSGVGWAILAYLAYKCWKASMAHKED